MKARDQPKVRQPRAEQVIESIGNPFQKGSKYYDWFAEADKNFPMKLDEYYLAVNMYRIPLYPHTVGHWLKDFEEEHEFKYVSCHGLRHTYCSLLLSQNVPIQTVSTYMGHSDSTGTLKVYSHFIPDTQDRVLNALAKLAV